MIKLVAEKLGRFCKTHRSLLCLLVLAVGVWLIQASPVLGEAYSRYLYPVVATVLTAVSRFVPFSLYDLLIVAAVAGTVLVLVGVALRRLSWRKALKGVCYTVGWLYVAFYWLWGMNYFRQNFYVRNQLPRAEVCDSLYFDFARDYIMQYNQSVSLAGEPDTSLLRPLSEEGYERLSRQLKIYPPYWAAQPKPMLLSRVMAKMGIKGYIGAYFNEPLVSTCLLPHEYPFTYLHEMAHVMGISSEAEANLYAFLIGSESGDAAVRASAYSALFGYVMGNARRILSPEQYQELLEMVSPQARSLYEKEYEHWRNLYSSTLGDVQERLYDWFLKNNRVTSGTQNYSEVIGYLLAYRQRFP